MTDRWRIDVGKTTFRHLSGLLRGYFARRLRGWGDPSELVMKVWLAGGRYYKGKAPLRGYLFLIARTVLADFWRGVERQVKVASGEFGELVGDLPTDVPSPESAVVREAERAAMLRAVEDLPDPFRQTLRLKLEGYDDAQIAVALGVPCNTVRSRLSRGRARLWDLLYIE